MRGEGSFLRAGRIEHATEEAFAWHTGLHLEVRDGPESVFMKVWEKEAPTTRKVLSRIPEGDYRPDPKSRSAREIAPPTMKEVLDVNERR